MTRKSQGLFRKRALFRALKDSILTSPLEQVAFGFYDECADQALKMWLCQHLPAGTSTVSAVHFLSE